MNFRLPLALGAAATLIVGTAAFAAPGATSSQPGRGDMMFADTRWDHDDDDGFRTAARKPIPRPDAAALRAVGVVKVVEVERDDGRLEVEGRDAQGHELDVKMDRDGKKVLRVKRDDDRWDD